MVWVAHRGDGTISVIDTAHDKVVGTVSAGTKMANRLKFTRDGVYALVTDPPRDEVRVFDTASGKLVKTIATAAGPSGILIAPDGKRAFIACANAGKVQVIDLETLTITGTVATGNQPDGMAWVR
jgi:YVTN family beta-propeller protein